MKEEFISAFAFKTGRQIEKLIKEQTDNLEQTNNMLEAKLLQWYSKEHVGLDYVITELSRSMKLAAERGEYQSAADFKRIMEGVIAHGKPR